MRDRPGGARDPVGDADRRTLLAAGNPTPDALTGGYELSFWIASGLVVLAIIVAVIVLEPVKAPAHEEAEPEPGSPGDPAYSEAA